MVTFLSKLKQHWHDLVATIIIIIFCIYSCLNVFTNFPQDLHTDETHWINHSILESTLLLRNEFSNEYWFLIDPFGSMTPSFGKFAIGIPLLLQGKDHISPKYQYYDWDQSPLYNWERGYTAADDAIKSGRYVILLFAIIALVFLYLIIREISHVTALLYLVIILSNPLFKFISGHVMMDIFEYAFSFGALYFSFKLLKSYNNKYVVMAGTMAAISTSAKMRGGLGLIFLLAVLVYLLIKNFKSKIQQSVYSKGILIAIISYSITFFILNPTMFTSPIEKASLFLSLNTFQQKSLVQEYPELALPTVALKSKAFIKNVFYQNNNLPCWWLEIILMLIGIWPFIKCVKRDRITTIGLSCFFIFTCTINAFWIPLDFERYYMPFLYFTKLLMSFGITGILRTITSFVQKSPEKQS